MAEAATKVVTVSKNNMSAAVNALKAGTPTRSQE